MLPSDSVAQGLTTVASRSSLREPADGLRAPPHFPGSLTPSPISKKPPSTRAKSEIREKAEIAAKIRRMAPGSSVRRTATSAPSVNVWPGARLKVDYHPCTLFRSDRDLTLDYAKMLTSSTNQYLRPEYLTPLPTTVKAIFLTEGRNVSHLVAWIPVERLTEKVAFRVQRCTSALVLYRFPFVVSRLFLSGFEATYAFRGQWKVPVHPGALDCTFWRENAKMPAFFLGPGKGFFFAALARKLDRSRRRNLRLQ